MTVTVVAVHVVVVVFPVPRARVVRRVDVDAVDFAFAGVKQRLQGVVVLTVDDDVGRLVRAPLNLADLGQPGVHRVAELTNNHQIIHGECVGEQCTVGAPAHPSVPIADLLHGPGCGLRVGAQFDGCPPANRHFVQANLLRQVLLEHEPQLLLAA